MRSAIAKNNDIITCTGTTPHNTLVRHNIYIIERYRMNDYNLINTLHVYVYEYIYTCRYAYIYTYSTYMYIAFHACAKSHLAFQLIGTELVGPATLHILALVPIKYDPFKNLQYSM